MQLLLSWRHRTGFSADASVKVEPEDEVAMKRLARYILRPPVSLHLLASKGLEPGRGPPEEPAAVVP